MRPYTVAFILAPHRSGSTLLDNLLASHPAVVSVGEVDKLRAYALQDRRFYDPQQPLTCSCGQAVLSCPFWQQVERQLGSPLKEVALQWPLVMQAKRARPAWEQRLQRLALSALRRRPALFRSVFFQKQVRAHVTMRDNWRLFDSIHAVSGASCIVDASKMAYRYRHLRSGHEATTRAIILCRDHRAVTFSLMRRGLSMEDAIIKWRRGVERIEEMVRDVTPDEIFRLTYEDMCQDPAGALRRIWGFLHLGDSTMPSARSMQGMHHVSGSPSKFDPERQAIRQDDSHIRAFNRAQLEYLDATAQPYAQQWGYTRITS